MSDSASVRYIATRTRLFVVCSNKDVMRALDDAPVKLKVKAAEFDWKPNEFQPLPMEPVVSSVSSGEAQQTVENSLMKRQITLVPYGCTKFRVSMFPVTENMWEKRN